MAASQTKNAHASHPGGKRFTETIRGIEGRAAAGPVTVGELLEICGPQGHGFLAIFLVLPFLQPVPLPGISSAIGLVLATIGGFVALGRPPWLPRILSEVVVQPETVYRLCANVEKLFGALEHVVRPRAQWLFSYRWFRMTNGVLWILHAVVFSLPLPIPLSNAFPAAVIFLIALGILEEDLAVIVLAYIGGLANVAFFAGLLALPALGWKFLGH